MEYQAALSAAGSIGQSCLIPFASRSYPGFPFRAILVGAVLDNRKYAVLAVTLLLPPMVLAQNASVSGRVADITDAVLPGAKI